MRIGYLGWLALTLHGSMLEAAGPRWWERKREVARPAVSDPVAIDEAKINALYGDIDRAISQFQAGIEALRAGQPKRGREQTDAALVTLRSAAEDCAQTRGCEAQRFFDAFQTLVRLQTLVLAPEPDSDRPQAPDDLPVIAEESPHTPAPQLPERPRPANLLQGKDLAALIQVNEPVKAALDDWLTWRRPQLMESYENYQYMRALMWPAYERAGLPEALLFGILATESAGKVHAVSRAGAAGPLQFMPATGRRYGLGGEGGFDQRFDPALSTEANVRYILDQLAQFGNDLELTLAAYNGGENRVKRLTERYPGKGFWSDQIYYSLPEETRDYVPKVLAAAYLFLRPQEFRLEWPMLDNEPALLPVALTTSLSELALCLGQAEGNLDGWFRTLRNLNPRIRPEQKIEAGTLVQLPAKLVPVYEQHCREGEFVARAAALHAARYPAGPSYVSYVVRRGDTLTQIAKRSGCTTVQRLADLNAIPAPRYPLKPGQQLKLPSCS